MAPEHSGREGVLRMKFLFNEMKPKGKAHFWSESIPSLGTEADTYCHMWTTGGLKRDRKGWVIQAETDREICTMCENNWGKQYAE